MASPEDIRMQSSGRKHPSEGAFRIPRELARLVRPLTALAKVSSPDAEFRVIMAGV